MLMNSKQILQCCGGRYLISPISVSDIVKGFTWDSRDCTPGCLFVALSGSREDGHDHVGDALLSGARLILVEHAPDPNACVLARELGAGIIEVSNTRSAIADLAREWRRHLRAQFVGVTGSSGKTTTKNMIRDALSPRYKVSATLGNQNNELGCPRTILNANPQSDFVVAEMGMDRPGDISALSKIVKQDIAVITNIGIVHMEYLGSQDNIAREKAQIVEGLPHGRGIAILNADDPYTEFICRVAHAKEHKIECIFYGRDKDVSAFAAWMVGNGLSSLKEDARSRCVWAEDVTLNDDGRASFLLCCQGFADGGSSEAQPTLFDLEPSLEREQCTLSITGMQAISDALAACAVAMSAGVPLKDIAKSLSESLPESGRMEILKGRSGYRVIDDTYNASPDSMHASLRAFADMDVKGRRYAVLGDMLELGNAATAAHISIGRFVAKIGLDGLICVGDLGSLIGRGAEDGGMDASKIAYADSTAAALGVLEGRLDSSDAVLCKASHAIGLSRVVSGLVS